MHQGSLSCLSCSANFRQNTTSPSTTHQFLRWSESLCLLLHNIHVNDDNKNDVMCSGPLSSTGSSLPRTPGSVLFLSTIKPRLIANQWHNESSCEADLCFAVLRCYWSTIADIQAERAARCDLLWACSSDTFNARHHRTTNKRILLYTAAHQQQTVGTLNHRLWQSHIMTQYPRSGLNICIEILTVS